MTPEAAVEAVEAAAEAINEFNAKAIGGTCVPLKDLSGLDREHALGEARAALEAAAPHMLAVAFDEAADAFGEAASWSDSNPSPEQVQRWLRSRANTYRPTP